MIKRHALGNVINEHDSPLPFKHSEEDVKYQKAYEIKALKKVSLVDTLGDIEGFGIEFKPEDYVEKKKLQGNTDAH